jgi:hypothetical protein
MGVIKHKRDVWRAVVLPALVFAASAASAFLVPAPVPLEELAQSADLVCKSTVIADRTIADGAPELMHRFEVREAELRRALGRSSHAIPAARVASRRRMWTNTQSHHEPALGSVL